MNSTMLYIRFQTAVSFTSHTHLYVFCLAATPKHSAAPYTAQQRDRGKNGNQVLVCVCIVCYVYRAQYKALMIQHSHFVAKSNGLFFLSTAIFSRSLCLSSNNFTTIHLRLMRVSRLLLRHPYTYTHTVSFSSTDSHKVIVRLCCVCI